MIIIANTGNGFLIEASEGELKEILGAVLGEVPKEINIGQKIPAIDYAATIRKLKSLPDNYEFKTLISCTEKFSRTVANLNNVVTKATEI